MPVAFLGNHDVTLYVSRRSQPMPFYYRNADGDELIFVHRGRGTIETDFGPLTFEPGDYMVLPRAVTYRLVPEDARQFLPDHPVAHRVRTARQGLARATTRSTIRRDHRPRAGSAL